MFEPVTKSIFRWGTIDCESGIMMYSHLLLKDDYSVLIDPVAIPNLEKFVSILGKPAGIIITNYPHLRGGPIMRKKLNIPLFIPDIEALDEDEKLTNTFIDLWGINDAIKYDSSTQLPLSIRAIRIPNRHEMALKYLDYLIVGDSAYGVNGKLTYYPKGIWPDETNRAKVTEESLSPIIRSTNVKGLLSGHNEDIAENLQGMV